MLNRTELPLWAAIQYINKNKMEAPHGSFIQATEKLLAARWLEYNSRYWDTMFYLDPEVAGYTVDLNGYTQQSTEQKKGCIYSGSRFPLEETDSLYLNVVWRSKKHITPDLFTTIDGIPDKSIAWVDKNITHKGSIVAEKTRDDVQLYDDQKTTTTVRVDVKKLKELSSLENNNKVNFGFTLDDKYFIDKTLNRDDIEIRVSVESFQPAQKKEFYLNDVLTATTLMGSIDLDTMELVVHNQPVMPVGGISYICEEHISSIVDDAGSQFSIKDMLEIVIPPNNRTSDPEAADILISHREIDGNSRMVLDPGYDMEVIKHLLIT